MRLFFISVIWLAMGCSSSAQKNQQVTAAEFEKGLSDKNVQLLDVRTAGEFRNGHIKGALQANWNNNTEFEERVNALDKTRPVYIYCLSGPRSSAAANWLRSNGYTNVVELNGGFSSWKRNGKPVEGMADVKQMSYDEYQQQITGREYVLVDFGAEWCPPCRKMEPIINEFIAANKQIHFIKIDGGVHTDVMKKLNAEGLPTFILYKNGKEVWKYTGLLSAEELKSIWQKNK